MPTGTSITPDPSQSDTSADPNDPDAGPNSNESRDGETIPAPVVPIEGTALDGPNTWLDLFDYGPGALPGVGPGYKVYEGVDWVGGSVTSRVDNHWIVDVDPLANPNEPTWNYKGGGMISPDRAFRFEDGVFVIEAEVSAGYNQSDFWPELVVSTAPAPTSENAGLYAFTNFLGGYWTFGCRIQTTRYPVCALYTPSDARVWEVPQSAHEVSSGENNEYFYASPAKDAWRLCDNRDEYLPCRDRFRIEIRRESFRLFVNGVLYYAYEGLEGSEQFPEAFVGGGDVYAYFASWIGGQGTMGVQRFEWDRIAINPPF